MSEEIKFEKALERLEKIVEDLEAGNISLEEALKKYAEGVRLSRTCQSKLNEAEKKIEILTRTLEGSLKKEPFQIQDHEWNNNSSSQEKRPVQNKKNSAKETHPDEEDLLF